ncbi:hypothetical protein KDW55_22375 [Burkholderia sp. AU19243]|uniref:hypothetical protein n=1 Tax=Burkholderia sp. AU19243 TaxID=2824810 RepID=UPI0004F7FDF7|nr:hypothetical protein [Burkholderia sp. AU19243]AIO38469.1 hypothetical protein DM40_3462 [Burkholderia cenocepacia]MBR7959579.1 hypothetical protein [Burkholderia vietnamiensis]MBR8144342.1 hypothetical protein [Burkholderia vietnamiensis]MBR8366066.1 hypothetical protein [Burkholderia sp. AU19243]
MAFIAIKTFIMKTPVCLGDATTHGGVVKLADWTWGYDNYFESGASQSIIKPSCIDWTTVADEQSKAEAEQLRQQQWKGGA